MTLLEKNKICRTFRAVGHLGILHTCSGSYSKKCFPKRLLDADSKFAQDVEYLFVAQCITDTKQILDSMNIAVRKCYRVSVTDPALNAGLLRDESSIQRFISKDQAYRFLQPVRGSPPYWQKVQYKLLSAIKQFGIFTWFLHFCLLT